MTTVFQLTYDEATKEINRLDASVIYLAFVGTWVAMRSWIDSRRTKINAENFYNAKIVRHFKKLSTLSTEDYYAESDGKEAKAIIEKCIDSCGDSLNPNTLILLIKIETKINEFFDTKTDNRRTEITTLFSELNKKVFKEFKR